VSSPAWSSGSSPRRSRLPSPSPSRSPRRRRCCDERPSRVPGQVALVTGASRGIGRAIALALAAKGFRVVGTATTEAGAAAIGEALAAHDGCRGIVLDVTAGDAAGAAIDAVVRDSGALHVLVNNAGITRDTLSMRMKDDDWDAVLATNLTAVFRASRAALRPMMKQRYGRIVNITSVVGASGNPGQANYAAAKAGVAGMTRSLLAKSAAAASPSTASRRASSRPT
jgi:3-oxoacyl-[acyl-carrier protein] reductase